MPSLRREWSLTREVLPQALATLRAHPLRTALGALAIAVAVFTTTTVITALEGIQLYARQNASRLFGSDTFVLAQIASPGQTSRRELEKKLPYAPNAQRNTDVVAGGRRFDYAAVTGTTAALADIRDLGIESGRFFREDEVRRASQVAVIGADIAAALFPAEDPLGQKIRLGGRGFDVIGVQGRLGTSGGASLDRYVWIPLPAFERVFGAPATVQLFARGANGIPAEVAVDVARAAMRARRQLPPGVEDNFDVLTPDAARSFVFRLSERIGLAAFPISAMALLAAIVVVTNTVLVSVSQRTREIGVRRALGAPRGQIIREVLAESMLVSLIGGGLALLLVWLLVDVFASLVNLPLRLRPSTIAWSLLASVVSGLVAGWYPARRAVHLDVVAALRTE